jgi:plastocyanin
MSTKILIGVLALVVAIGGYVFIDKQSHEHTESPALTQTNTENTPIISPAHGMHTVVYTDAGYTPDSITIKAGDMISFENNSKNELMVTFGEHDDHDTAPDKKTHPSVKPGETTMVTFPEAGTFNYHNHHDDEQEGSVVVE